MHITPRCVCVGVCVCMCVYIFVIMQCINGRVSDSGDVKFSFIFHLSAGSGLSLILYRYFTSYKLMSDFANIFLFFESRRGRDFPHLSRPVPGTTHPLTQWVPGHSGG